MLFFFGIVGLFGIFFGMANPALPPAPELAKLTFLTPQAIVESSRWETFYQSKELIPKVPESIERAHEAIKENRWPDKIESLQLALMSLHSQLWFIEQTLKGKGCYAPDMESFWTRASAKNIRGTFQAWQKRRGIRLHRLVMGIRLIVLKAIMKLQGEKPDEGAQLLLLLENRLFSYLRRCAQSPGDVLGLFLTLRRVHNYFSYALVQPRLSEPVRIKVFQALSRWEQTPRFLSWAIQRESRAFFGFVKKLSELDDWEKTPWPWYDLKDTEKMMKRYVLRYIFLSRIPPDKPYLWRPYPIEHYFQQIRSQPPWLFVFRYNALGRRILSQIRPVYRNILMIWYKNRCMFSAYRLHWFHLLKKRGIILPDSVLQGSAPRNPFSNAVFRFPVRDVCAIPSSYQTGVHLSLIGPESLTAMPPTPPPPPPKLKQKEKKKVPLDPEWRKKFLDPGYKGEPIAP